MKQERVLTLNYECQTQQDGKLCCSFVQVLLSNQSDEAKLQESLTQTPAVLADQTEINESCKSFSDMEERMKAVEEGRQIEGLSDDDYAVAKEFLESGNAEGFRKQLPSLKAFCADPTTETAEGMFRAFHEMSRTTCTTLVSRYDQTFVRVNDNLWVVESSPTGDCGIVNISTFYLPDPERTDALELSRAENRHEQGGQGKRRNGVFSDRRNTPGVSVECSTNPS